MDFFFGMIGLLLVFAAVHVGSKACFYIYDRLERIYGSRWKERWIEKKEKEYEKRFKKELAAELAKFYASDPRNPANKKEKEK